MGTITSQQLRGKGPSIASVWKTLLVIKLVIKIYGFSAVGLIELLISLEEPHYSNFQMKSVSEQRQLSRTFY